MRFKQRPQQAALPEINLIPMLNVMMGILAFFVMVTMMLTTQQGVEVQLPGAPDAATPPPTDTPDPLVVTLTLQGIALEDQPVTNAQLTQAMQRYLETYRTGIVVLQADPNVPYEQVVQQLGVMKDIGGNRVSLAIDE
ncbi:ExbD/TolR family protein [Thermocoleostomius sinensis]|jgi:biopolymer transport protein ExbD|uniref:Biopolymer transporter ExbD n=1 Tax=Thermocoleostomius sinensis A174 TaxID=2016057 RepID=A0A9E9C8Q8_9CYAN|nr:biopolymer transporter ExbD [Thermocoleostomius sinensis]WAL61669.1 biopolymer transporter ExbD [Thermocoleostomius sinensis A174]